MLGNLITNACQAMKDSGHLLISSDQLPVGSDRGFPAGIISGISEPPAALTADRWVRIRVEDTGSGITPEVMHRLFEPLFTTKLRGIGLGLAVSKKLVEANGGRIEVQSEPGQGSTFSLYLPVKGS